MANKPTTKKTNTRTRKPSPKSSVSKAAAAPAKPVAVKKPAAKKPLNDTSDSAKQIKDLKIKLARSEDDRDAAQGEIATLQGELKTVRTDRGAWRSTARERGKDLTDLRTESREYNETHTVHNLVAVVAFVVLVIAFFVALVN